MFPILSQITKPEKSDSLYCSFQLLKDKAEVLNVELEEVRTVRDKFEKDLEQTIQQLTEAKTSVADLKAENDEASGKLDELTSQNKVGIIRLINILDNPLHFETEA